MKTFFITCFLLVSMSQSFASDQKDQINQKLERIENLSIAIKKRLHPEVFEALPVAEREAMLERLTTQESELKRLNSQLREQFDQLDHETQRKILIRQSKLD